MAISAEFRKALLLEMNPNAWAAHHGRQPRRFSRHINGTYPKKRPLSTMPPNILAVLPKRFLTTSSIVSWDATSSCTTRGRTSSSTNFPMPSNAPTVRK